MRYRVAQYSIRGARPTNQDRVAVAERSNAALMVLADGLGGHLGGEIAAETLTNALLRFFQSVRQPVISRPSAFL
ncbi:MAG: protein phosphatase 2C domain-containing protein, partial [Pseudomonadota bacterium]